MATDQNQAVPEKVVFSEKQQQKVEELIRSAQGRAAREVRAELSTAKAELASVQRSLLLSRRTLMREVTGASRMNSERGVR